jgi:hypothetical protein
MIAGAGSSSSGLLQGVREEMMVEMPLHNYHDLPRADIHAWCDFFELRCKGEVKTQVLQDIWEQHLTSLEQTAVLADLKLFLSMQQGQGQQSSSDELDNNSNNSNNNNNNNNDNDHDRSTDSTDRI